MAPVIIVNAKTYPEATGERLSSLARACEETGAALAVQAYDLKEASRRCTAYAQHVDPGTPGRHTGFLLAAHAKSAGATGTILNHSEHKTSSLKESVAAAREAELTVVICADTPDEAAEAAALNPDYVAVEPPELIGGDVSVSEAQPEIITAAKEAVGDVPLLVGAGIKTGADVKKALELGAAGVLVASGVVKADDPAAVLRSFTGS